jgi:NAD(P)-dependent dehydrogenase (short-subunit alcohol dehydrogenase family)
MEPLEALEALEGRTALVTGASRGIGLAIARRLAAAGARVAMAARSEDELSRVAEEVGGIAVPADVSSSEAVARLVERTEERLGRAPDILVSSAGAFTLAPLVETSAEEFDRQLEVNLRGPFLVARAFLPAMLAMGSGHIVNLGSIAGRIPLAGNAAYGAAKFGLRGLHEILAVELQGTGVRATLVEPAATDTPLWDPLDPDRRDDLPSRGQMLRAEDVARAVVFAVGQPPGVEISLLSIRATG